MSDHDIMLYIAGLFHAMPQRRNEEEEGSYSNEVFFSICTALQRVYYVSCNK